MNNWLLTVVVMIVATAFVHRYNNEAVNRGIALSSFLENHYGMSVPPEQARYFNVVVTTTDVQLSIENFKVFEGPK